MLAVSRMACRNRTSSGAGWSRNISIRDPHLWVYDKTSGELLAGIALPANATGSPITDMAGGKQYIVFAVGGAAIPEELIAVSP